MLVKYKGLIKKIVYVLSIILFLLTVILSLSLRWMFATWNDLTMDEVMFHLTSPLEGTNDGMVRQYLLESLFPALLLLILFMFVIWFCKNGKNFHLFLAGCNLAMLLILGDTIIYTWDELKIGQYLAAQGTESSFIENYYINPNDVELQYPKKKRNLIYIFLESMEITYSNKMNGGDFNVDMIPELTELAMSNEDFSGSALKLNGAYVPTGTTWTMGAMFAHTSGLPLSVSIDSNSMDTQDTFFAGAVTLGDILHDAGYSQTLLIGSDATFGGRRLYFSEHGNYDIVDYLYAKKNKLIPKKYKVWWGYEDHKLFEIARDKLLDLSAEDEPFNLTILTADTHFEDGYVCKQCPNIFGDNQYANVMSCSSRQIKDFVSWVQKQDFYENTAIILAGDHTTMDKDFCENVDDDYVRKVYTCFINSEYKPRLDSYRTYTTLDLYPTTLAALGINIKGNRLGLGVNLFSDTQTIAERFGYNKIDSEFIKKS